MHIIRRTVVLTALCFYGSGLLLAMPPLRPGRLTCMYLENPLGIDRPAPFLSWTLQASDRNQLQSAYEILVSDNISDIRKGKGNCWTTGKVNSAGSIHVNYAGIPLKPFTRYYWSVRVYNQAGEASGWSPAAWFETAMLSPGDWSADWIGDGSVRPGHDEDYYLPDRMPLFKKEFRMPAQVVSARLYISGVGYYEAFLNGKKVGDHVLDPGFTTYKKEVLYAVYDVDSLLHNGLNALSIMLGNGWWNPLPFKFFGRWDLRDYQQTGRPCVKAELHLIRKNGDRVVISTDGSWKTMPGWIYRNNVYLGEYADGRMKLKGWNEPGNSLGDWKEAVVVAGPDGELTSQLAPPIRITRRLRPVSIREVGKDTFIVDMGQNFAGVAALQVSGPAGTQIRIRYGEDVFPDGRINLMTTAATQIKKGGIRGGPGAPETAWQEDRYTLSGNGREQWHPHFTFHGFRYLELTGWPGKPSPDDIEGLRMNADLPSTGSFECSNDMFNRLHEAVRWTFLSNVFSVQSDCPGREKMGYGGDMVATAEAFMYNFQMGNFYRKTVRDFANEQRPLGGITEIAPFTGIADRGYGDGSGPLGWELAFPYLQDRLFEFYGDSQVIADYYPAFRRQVEWLKSRSRENLFDWDIGDHEALDPKAEAFSASAFYYHHLLLASKFAGIVGNRQDSVNYGKLAQSVKRSIQYKYYVPGTGRFDNATQSAQAFALWYELSPDREKTLQILLDELHRHHDHVATGIFGTKMMLDVLYRERKAALAYELVNQRDYPGWGHMLAKGATTLWETWAYPRTGPSQNHPMFGSVDEWFYRSLLGINPASPGFAHIVIRPQPAGDLQWARGGYESVRGFIGSSWKIEGGMIRLEVDIPAGCSARIFVPTNRPGEIREGGKPCRVEEGAGFGEVQIGSGQYVFTAPYSVME